MQRLTKRGWTLALFAAAVAAGCIPSLHPLYTEDDLIFEPALLGVWQEGGDAWTFERSGELQYRLTISDGDDEPGVFEARLTRLGSHRFLDVYPDARTVIEHFFPHMIPAHTFYKLEMKADVVRLVALDESWLEAGIEAGRIEIKHELVELPTPFGPTSISLVPVLTASTEDLQAFFLAHADDPEAFRTSGPDAAAWELRRRGPPEPGSPRSVDSGDRS